MSEAAIPKIVPAGDAALMAVFAEEIKPEVNARVRALAAALEGRTSEDTGERGSLRHPPRCTTIPCGSPSTQASSLVLEAAADNPTYRVISGWWRSHAVRRGLRA